MGLPLRREATGAVRWAFHGLSESPDIGDNGHMTPSSIPDPLGVRASTAAVMARAHHVRLVPEAAARLADAWVAAGLTPPVWEGRHHWFDGTHRSANWLLALDAVNFSFWSQDPDLRWEVEYKGETLDGYWALAACLTRAVEEGRRIWDAGFLTNLYPGDATHIFRGAKVSNMPPMLFDRLNNLREVGRVLQQDYQGQFMHVIERAKGNVVHLVALLARDFPSFNDVAEHDGEEVYFYKRAQLLVSDLWGAFGGKGHGAFGNLEVLTAFADYKLPQLLRHHGVLAYEPELATTIEARAIIPQGSAEEVEIRAATVQACELLRDLLAERGLVIHAFQVDWLLWQQSQGMAMAHPYHLTRSIYY